MTPTLPAHAPRTTSEAFAYINSLKDGATVDDLKIMALVEAIGLALYEDLAARTENPQAASLLRENGREEMLHAQRLAQAIEILTGEAFPIPPLAEIPFFTQLDPFPVTRDALAKLAQAEFAGEDLYAGIAKSFDHPEVLALLAQNGREEIGHGQRLERASALL